MNWQEQKKWSDAYLPEIKTILGLYLIGEATQEEDATHNTDLVVVTMAAVRIACRVRRPGYAEKYGDEFTIRSQLATGSKTELAKIIEGWGDYMFYGHAGESGLTAWALCDLKPFRLWFNRKMAKNGGKVPGIIKHNQDGETSFRAYNFNDMPTDFIIARKKI